MPILPFDPKTDANDSLPSSHLYDGEGLFLLEGSEKPMRAGDVLVAPDGVPHGVRNSSSARLLVMVVLAPAPRHE